MNIGGFMMYIKNKSIFGFFYNNFDFIIRFLYCRFPFISKIMFWKIYTSDFEDLDKKFEEMKGTLIKNKFTIKGKIIIELGPGNSFINAYNFLMNGAEKVVLVDKFSRHMKSKKQKKFFQNEIDFIKRKYNRKVLPFIKESELDSHKIQFIEGDVVNLNFKSKFDLITSISVFEHVKDVKRTIKKLSEILKTGGLMYHKIDLRDHYNFNKPLMFYKYSDWTWDNLMTREGVSYTNRLSDYEYNQIFKKNKMFFVESKVNKIKNNVTIMEVLLKK